MCWVQPYNQILNFNVTFNDIYRFDGSQSSLSYVSTYLHYLKKE